MPPDLGVKTASILSRGPISVAKFFTALSFVIPLEWKAVLFFNVTARGRTSIARMTITKKVGSLLLLLTVGSLIGILTFAVFLQRTSVDFLFFLAASNQERMLQQLYVNTIMIRDGHEEIRASQQNLIEDFDDLLKALENGGAN